MTTFCLAASSPIPCERFEWSVIHISSFRHDTLNSVEIDVKHTPASLEWP